MTWSGRQLRPHVEATAVGQGCGRQGYLDLVLESRRKRMLSALKLIFQKGSAPHTAPKERSADAPGTEAFPTLALSEV